MPPSLPDQTLTERQLDVLVLLGAGKPNKLIARELGISAGTVKTHLAAIFRNLNVSNRTQAVVAARSVIEARRARARPALRAAFG